MLPVAFVPPTEPVRKTGLQSPAHSVTTRQVPTVQGDPFNTRNLIYPGDYYNVGKPFAFPGVHKNIFTNIPGIQSVAQPFWGQIVTKVTRPKKSVYPAGVQQPRRESMNLQAPATMPYGDLATFGYGDPIPGRDTY